MSEADNVVRNPDPELILSELEQITETVTQALVDHDTKALENLVIQQIQCAKRLASCMKEQIDKKRVLALISCVDTQQQLAQQALAVTDVFLEGLNSARAFSRLG